MAGSLHTEHGFVLVCKTYYSEIQSWFVAQGFSLFDLMISGLFPDDPTMFANVAERTITKHFRCYMTSLEMSMNSMAAMFSWTKGMLRSTKLDNDSRLVDFARMLEKAVAQLFLSRYMTQDIEMCSEGLGTVRKRDYLNTLESIANVAVQMASVYKQVFMEEAITIIVAFSQHRAAQHVWLICLRFAVSVGNHLIF
nr:isocitrate dehydrogenase [NADP] cytoplasmic-like [Rhipicephalus microplus]